MLAPVRAPVRSGPPVDVQGAVGQSCGVSGVGGARAAPGSGAASEVTRRAGASLDGSAGQGQSSRGCEVLDGVGRVSGDDGLEPRDGAPFGSLDTVYAESALFNKLAL